jgi:ATP-binding cassette subfamily B protein
MMVDKVLNPVKGTPVLERQQSIFLLLMILLGLVGASGGRCLLNIFIGRTSSIIGTRITKELRERLQAKLVSLAVDYYNRHSVGSLMSRVLWDVDYFQGFVQQVAQGFLLNVMLVLGIGAMLFSMNWRLALLVLLPIPFVVVGTTFFWKHVYPRHYRVWDSQSKTAQLLSGLLSGIRLVKAFAQEGREQKRFSDTASYLQESRRSLETSVSTFNPIMGFVFGLGGLIIWFFGGNRHVLRSHLGPEHVLQLGQRIPRRGPARVRGARRDRRGHRGVQPRAHEDSAGARRVPQRDLRLRPVRAGAEERVADH